MVRLWGNFPVITTVGGDITEDNVEEMYPTYFPPQNTAEEAYAQIEKDLTEAVENPNTPTNDASDKSILTKSVARAMLAKVYAEKPLRDYAKVIKYADELAADGFDLVEDFSDLWAYDTEKKTAGYAILKKLFSKLIFLLVQVTGVRGCLAAT